jgi:hypothetical protein
MADDRIHTRRSALTRLGPSSKSDCICNPNAVVAFHSNPSAQLDLARSKEVDDDPRHVGRQIRFTYAAQEACWPSARGILLVSTAARASAA